MTKVWAAVAWLGTQTYVETTEVLLILALGLIAYGTGQRFGWDIASLVAGVIVLVYAWPPRSMPSAPVPERKVS